MAGKTRTVVVNNATPAEIKASVFGTEIVVFEDPSVAGYPTTAFSAMKPTSSDAAIRVPLGGTYTFRKASGRSFFAPNETVGHIQPITSSTFAIDEDGI